MTKEPKALFEIDASKILAKLHLAGVMKIKLDANEFLINSGIKNDDPGATPDKPGKVKFDLTNTQGEYEVGYCGVIKYERSFEIQKKLDELVKNLSQNDQKEILAKTKNEDGKHNEELMNDLEKQAGIKLKNAEDINDEIKKAQEDIKKQNEQNMKDYNQQYAKIKKKAAIALKEYFTTFAGEDKARKIDEDILVKINIPLEVKKSNDPSLIKNFEIRPMSDKDKEIMLKKFQDDPKNCKERIVFKVGYSIELDK